MKVYVVYQVDHEHLSTDACWDDGWYDDYYETITDSTSIIGIYATEELAQKAVDKYGDECAYDSDIFYRVEEVLEKLEDVE